MAPPPSRDGAALTRPLCIGYGATAMLRILVLSTFNGRSADVIRDYLFAFNAYSRHRYFYVFDCGDLDDDFDFRAFDVILIFWNVDLLGSDLGRPARERIRAAPALKVLFLQDEYRDVRPMNAAMRALGIQVMFTCVADADHETFYPRSLVPSLEATYGVLTGYVPAYLERRPRPSAETRPLDLGYRSRDTPFWLGDLGREKRIIADRFQAISAAHGLRADISVREVDRLYGGRWVSFLRRSRCVLGTASGASVVDLTGEIRHRGHAPRVRDLGGGLSARGPGHVRVRAVGRGPTDPVLRARPVRHQAALLRGHGRNPLCRLGDQGAAPVPAGHRDRPRGLPRLPHVPVLPEWQDAVPGG